MCIDCVISNFTLELHTVLQDLERKKFFMDAFLDVRKSVRCLKLLLENIVFELNLITRSKSCSREMLVHFTNWVARISFSVSPGRKCVT